MFSFNLSEIVYSKKLWKLNSRFVQNLEFKKIVSLFFGGEGWAGGVGLNACTPGYKNANDKRTVVKGTIMFSSKKIFDNLSFNKV